MKIRGEIFKPITKKIPLISYKQITRGKSLTLWKLNFSCCLNWVKVMQEKQAIIASRQESWVGIWIQNHINKIKRVLPLTLGKVMQFIGGNICTYSLNEVKGMQE